MVSSGSRIVVFALVLVAALVEAVRKLQVRYPVVQDNDFATWKRYGVRAWPTLVLVDRKGVVRYRQIGEGACGNGKMAAEKIHPDGARTGLQVRRAVRVLTHGGFACA